RTPSSARAVKVTAPAGKVKVPVQRAEKLSMIVLDGPPLLQSWLIVGSHAVIWLGGASVVLAKYSTKNWPVPQPPAGVTVKVMMLERCPSGFTTNTASEPAVWIS